MLPPLFRIDLIADACHKGELILTANQRLRSKALQAWGQYQQAQGITVWEAPRLMTLEQWFSHCWQQLQTRAYEPSQVMIVSAEQQRVLWEGITENCGLMQPEVLAKQAASGFQALERWQLPLTKLSEFEPSPDNSNDTETDNSGLLLQWCNEFKEKLRSRGYITPEQSYRIIGQAFTEGTLAKEKTIHLLGFDDLPPLFEQQLSLASEQLEKVEADSYEPLTRIRTSCANTEAEMTTVAEWAKSIIEKEPLSRVGIIVPNLGQCRGAIERALVNSFEGHSLLAETPRYTYPFNISAGTPLAESPFIHDTFQLLKLTQQQWPIETLSSLLFSPFWGALSQEREQRSQLVKKLEELSVFEIKLSELRYWAEKLGEEDENNLFHYFSDIKRLEEKPDYRLPSAWVDYFLEHLALLNWPGERQPDSHEYQQTELWYQLLETFCSLDSTLGTISAFSAIRQLQGMASHQPFQAQVPDSPIQVLGVLEGAGLHFSHCWILGLHQQVWPPAPSPNPLLPLQLQRQHNMPHASSLRELAFAESLTRNYLHCADHIVFSSPEYDESSEQPLLPSPLIDGIPFSPFTINLNTEFDCYQKALQDSQIFEKVSCHNGPAVSSRDYNEHGELSGGVNVIKAQATNPFDAFAMYRLHAKTPITPVNGFSPIEVGNILHQALAVIWEKLKTQEALLECDETTLEQLVTRSIAAQITLLKKRKPQHFGDALCELEIKRQTQLILKWLNTVEKNRPSFKVVAIEESCQVQLQGVQFTVRLDRVDQLNDGSYLIIDYKTGTSRVSDWQGERPREPQLPLYLITRQDAVSGIAFAEINVRTQHFQGLCSDENSDENSDKSNGENDAADKPSSIDGIHAIHKSKANIAETWEAAKQHWQTVLSQQLTDFLSGNCNVDYRDNISLNYNKNLQSLNRLYDKKRLHLKEAAEFPLQV